jgi:hypothetical protein
MQAMHVMEGSICSVFAQARLSYAISKAQSSPAPLEHTTAAAPLH